MFVIRSKDIIDLILFFLLLFGRWIKKIGTFILLDLWIGYRKVECSKVRFEKDIVHGVRKMLMCSGKVAVGLGKICRKESPWAYERRRHRKSS